MFIDIWWGRVQFRVPCGEADARCKDLPGVLCGITVLANVVIVMCLLILCHVDL